MTIRVYLVDDHYFARRGLRRLLDLEQGIDVVGEASNAEEALSQIKVLSPDVVL
ncbi:MAG: response regulator, partial [Lysobacteraceae bacterium]